MHGRDDNSGYGELAFAVVNNAIDDIKKYRYSKTVVGKRLYSEAMSFMRGGPMLDFWCGVIHIDASRVIEGVKNGNVHAKF